MRVLYVATDQSVPGTTGGSTHVRAVADGLAALGHDVHVAATPGGGFPRGAVHWHPLAPPAGLKQLRFLRASAIRTMARTMAPDVIIERYYNFGGEGVSAGHALGIPSVLEVNAPIVDYPGSPKRLLDRALIVEPMRRWREWQCATAGAILTPSAAIVPSSVPREKIFEIEWGADTVRFHPGAVDPGGPPTVARRGGDVVAVFAGAFRRWHGAVHLVEAIRRIRAGGNAGISALLIGDGPELAEVRRQAEGLAGVVFAGAVSHERMPVYLATADIGVAPFDIDAHAPLALDFYWSPLKVFEYMATGLPVVAPNIPRLQRIITSGEEGLLYDAADPAGLAAALTRLAADTPLRAALGAAARARAVVEFGWDVHCRKLDAIIRGLPAVRPSVSRR